MEATSTVAPSGGSPLAARLDRYFDVSARGSTISTELRAGASVAVRVGFRGGSQPGHREEKPLRVARPLWAARGRSARAGAPCVFRNTLPAPTGAPYAECRVCRDMRLLHNPPTDPVRRTVMGRPMLRAAEYGRQVGRERRQSDRSRSVSHPLGSEAFRTPLCNSLYGRQSRRSICEHARVSRNTRALRYQTRASAKTSCTPAGAAARDDARRDGGPTTGLLSLGALAAQCRERPRRAPPTTACHRLASHHGRGTSRYRGRSIWKRRSRTV